MFKNTQNTYGAISKVLHWGMAFMIAGLLYVGLVMKELPLSGMMGLGKFKVYDLHKSMGIAVLALAALRGMWHLYSHHPALVSGMNAFERLAARSAHILLYVAMFGMPLSGWLMSSAYGRTVKVFDLFSLPDFVEKNKDLAHRFETVHSVMAWTLIALIVVHAAAAFKHHFINKDDTLRRMLPFVRMKESH